MRKALLVLGVQNDFINGALGTPETEAMSWWSGRPLAW